MVKLAAVSTWTFLNLLLSSICASDLSHLLYNFDFEVLQGNELRGGITPWRGQNVFLGESHQGREVFMPMVGLGTWQWSNQRAYRGVQMALKVGYRHIDTAMTYKNQAGIGRAIRDSSVPRTDIFITSKVPGGLNFVNTTTSAYLALKQLNTSYVDLMLIHFPGDLAGKGGKQLRLQQWRALEEFYKRGHALAIGVSHFCRKHVEEILEIATVKIAVNQVQYHVGMGSAGPNATDDKEYMRSKGIVYQSFSPLCGPCPPADKEELFNGELISSIAKAHGKTNAQVALKWITSQGIPVIPKTDVLPHLIQNLDLFNWSLTASEMEALTKARTPEVAGGEDGTSGDCAIE